MALFDPDDFSGRPYEGGMNQALHFVFGAALLGVTHFLTGLPIFWSVIISGFSIVVWEAHQLLRRNAALMDYVFDLIYWLSGLAAWAFAIHMGLISGYAEIFLVAPLLVWVIEYTRIRVMSNGK